MNESVCLMSNCRNAAPSDEPFCAWHRGTRRARSKPDPTPPEPGAYRGDRFYPFGGTEASHEWDGSRWQPCHGDAR